MLNTKSISQVSEPVLPHESNFELMVNVAHGSRLETSNYATAITRLDGELKYSQHDKVSMITDFSIAKVIRDDEGKIINSTLIHCLED